jgi:hypothetical protein
MAALKKKRLMERMGMTDDDTNGSPEGNLEIYWKSLQTLAEGTRRWCL